MSESISCMRNQFRRWVSTPKEFFIFFFAFMFTKLTLGDLGDLCVAYKTAVTPWVYPFIFWSHYYIFLFFTNLVLLFSDAPFMNETQLFYIIRSGKKKWFYGQVLYMLLSSFLYAIFIFFCTLILMIPYMKFSWEWGKIIESFSIQFASGFDFIGFSSTIIETFSPISALLVCLLLNTLAGLFLGLLIFNLNLIFQRGAGSACAIIILIFQYVLENPEGASDFIMKHFIPVCWMDLSFYHNKAGGMSLIYPFITLPILCLLLFLLGQYLTEKSTFCTQENI